MSITELIQTLRDTSIEDLRGQIAILETERDQVVTKANAEIDLIQKLIMVKTDEVSLRPPTIAEVAARYVPEDFPSTHGDQIVAGIMPAPKIVVDPSMPEGTWALVGTTRRESPPPTAGEKTEPTAILCRPEQVETARKVIAATEPESTPAPAPVSRSQEKRFKAQGVDATVPISPTNPYQSQTRSTKGKFPVGTKLEDKIAAYLDAMGPSASGAIARGIGTIDKDAVLTALEADPRFDTDEHHFWNLKSKIEAKKEAEARL